MVMFIYLLNKNFDDDINRSKKIIIKLYKKYFFKIWIFLFYYKKMKRGKNGGRGGWKGEGKLEVKSGLFFFFFNFF